MLQSALHPTPPQPPMLRPRLRLSPTQWIGLPLMALLPLLAAAGVFGERSALVEAAQGPLVVRARFPTRLRYRQRVTLDLSVSNQGAVILEDVRVRIDSIYLGRFSGVSLSPHASPDGWVRFGALEPASSVRLTVTMEGEDAGTADGRIVAADARGKVLQLVVRTFVFP